MGRLIVSAQVTVDGVMDQLEGWFDADDESSQHGLEQLRAADALVLGRETYEFLSSSGRPRRGSTPSSSTDAEVRRLANAARAADLELATLDADAAEAWRRSRRGYRVSSSPTAALSSRTTGRWRV